MRSSKSGFAAIETVITVVIVAAIAVTGYYVWRNHNNSQSSTASSLNYQSPPVTTPGAPQVTTASDLNSAVQALNQTSVSSNNVDSTQLSNQAAGF